MTVRVLLRVLLAGGVLLGFRNETRAIAEDEPKPTTGVYPGKTWETRNPKTVALSRPKLDAFRDCVGGRGCIVRHGYLVYTWGDVSQRADVASACKPWYTHFLFKALEDGRISSLDQPVSKWEPRLNTINQKLGYKDRSITWRHMANQISGYGVSEPPGAAFDYNDWQMALFADTLFLKVYGASFETVDAQVLHPLLTDILQCEDEPTFTPFGLKDRPMRVGVSVRDFSRLGLLYLRQGRWKGQQVIRSEHAVMAVTSPLPNTIPRTAGKEAEMIPGQRSHGSRRVPDNQTDHFGSYSWLWWVNGVDRHGTRMWPDAPHDTFGAFGHGGPRGMFVIPSLDLVVSYNDARKLEGWHSGPDTPINQAMKLLVEACPAMASRNPQTGFHFPPPGESLENQARRTPSEVGLKPDFVAELAPHVRGRWALWRHGYLVHVDGDFNQKSDVASLRKTWHALTVGAAIQQGRLTSASEKISRWASELTGAHAEATWWHVITQTSAFDYPYDHQPAYKPGQIWTYSDKNPRVLCHALARLYGRKDFHDNYAAVVRQAYFDGIGLRGWQAVPKQDGIRFHFDLEDMGRLGLLVLARGRWEGNQLIPQSFVEQLERKQTDAIPVNYDGPDDGKVDLDPRQFPEAPYGFMTWVNTDGDFYPGADKAWAWGAGAGGSRVLWNRNHGLVFAAFGADSRPSTNGIPHILERSIVGPNPLVASAQAPVAADVRRLGTKAKSRHPKSEMEGSLFASAATKGRNLGRFPKWQRIESALEGPPSQGRGPPERDL